MAVKYSGTSLASQIKNILSETRLMIAKTAFTQKKRKKEKQKEPSQEEEEDDKDDRPVLAKGITVILLLILFS